MFKIVLSLLILFFNLEARKEGKKIVPEEINIRLTEITSETENLKYIDKTEERTLKNNKIDTYNVRSDKEIGFVSARAVEKAEPLVTITLTPTPLPTLTFTPTPTPSPSISPTPITTDPEPTPFFIQCPPPPHCPPFITYGDFFEGGIKDKNYLCPAYPDVMCPTYSVD